MFRKIIKNKKGTALLIALLVMGVFIAVSLALSSLILREVRITKSFIDTGQAYYSAESGIELALYGLNTRLPGWQPSGPSYDEDGFQSFSVDADKNTVGEFSLENRCSAYPCFDEEEFDFSGIRNLGQARYFYDVLDLNESLTIPLFVSDQAAPNGVKDVEDFVVEFFSPLNPREHLEFGSKGEIDGWDVLRWKLIGVRKDNDASGGENQTETISDFNSVAMIDSASNDEEERIRTNAERPSWFGTQSCNAKNGDQDVFGNRYYPGIQCIEYSYKGMKIDTSQFDQLSKINTEICPQHMAKEFYVYDYFGGEKTISRVDNCYPIKNFLANHTLNYLILTNMVNPAVLKDEYYNEREKLSRLFFRIELGSPSSGEVAETVRPVANITANGYAGKSKQTINVKIARGSFLPVFNFSLYSTFMDSGKDHDFDYWYKERDDLSL